MRAPITPGRPRTLLKRGVAALTVALLSAGGVALTGVAAHADGGAPVAGTTTWATANATAITMNLCAGAMDPEGDPISLAGMDSTLDINGTIDSYDATTCLVGWAPDAGFSGTVDFNFVLTDGTSQTDVVGKVTVAAGPGDPSSGAPVAVDDNYTTPVSTALVVADPGLFANDSDPDGDTFSLTSVTQPSHGTVIANNTGGFSYTPVAGYIGADSFSYQLVDSTSKLSNWATVTIEVTSANQAPSAPARSYDVELDTPLSLGADWKTVQLLVGATDPDGDTLTVDAIVLADLGGMLPGESIGVTGGDWVYTPPTGFVGTRHFGYVVTDGVLSTTSSISFVIGGANAAPVAVPDSYTVQEGGVLVVDAANGLLANDTDPEGKALSYLTGYIPLHGTLLASADGSFSYTPDAGFYGQDVFRYYAVDPKGAQSELTAVTITVTPDPDVNHAPEAVDDAYATVQGGTLVVTPGAGVLANDIDIDGDTLSVFSHTDPSYGTLTLNADGSFTYVSDPQSFGGDSFSYIAQDPGGLTSYSVTVTISVSLDADQTPQPADDEYTTPVDTPLVVGTPHHLLANDSDPNGDAFTVRSYGSPTHGTVTGFDYTTGSFTYTPDAGFVGDDVMSYNLEDANGYVSGFVLVTIHVVAESPEGPGGGPGGQPRPCGPSNGTVALPPCPDDPGAGSGLASTGASGVAPLLAVACLLGGLGIATLFAARRRARSKA